MRKRLLVIGIVVVSLVVVVVYLIWPRYEPDPGLRVPTPALIGIPLSSSSEDIAIKVNRLVIKDRTGDEFDNVAELRFVLFAIREDEESVRQVFPGHSTPKLLRANSEYVLENFALTVTDFRSDETVYLYLLAFDEDTQGNFGEIGTDAAVSESIEILQKVLERDGILPDIGMSSFIVGSATSLAASALISWWREADLVGEYLLKLTPDNNWYLERDLFLQSTDANMDFYVSVMRQTSPSNCIAAVTPEDAGEEEGESPVEPSIATVEGATPDTQEDVSTPYYCPPTPTSTAGGANPVPLLTPPSPDPTAELLQSVIVVRDAERAIGAEIDYAVTGERGWADCSNVTKAYEAILNAPAYEDLSENREYTQANSAYRHAIDTIVRTSRDLYANCLDRTQYSIPPLTWTISRTGINDAEEALNRAVALLLELIE